MSIVKSAFVAASLVIAATAAHAQNRGGLTDGFHGNTQVITTYIGGPKSGLTQTIRGSYAQAVPVRPRGHGTRVRFSGGANAIGVDYAN